MSEPQTGVAVRQTIVVQASQERAFTVFTEQFGSWWPLEGKSVGAAPAVAVAIEPRVGGRWYERAADGSECSWGDVLAYEPPERIVLRWDLSAAFEAQRDAGPVVEVRFVAEGPATTRVELEHRGLEHYGDAAGPASEAVAGDRGWPQILAAYAAAV
jgi:uncharacterized protein YndB with AHSA1/START domain